MRDVISPWCSLLASVLEGTGDGYSRITPKLLQNIDIASNVLQENNLWIYQGLRFP